MIRLPKRGCILNGGEICTILLVKTLGMREHIRHSPIVIETGEEGGVKRKGRESVSQYIKYWLLCFRGNVPPFGYFARDVVGLDKLSNFQHSRRQTWKDETSHVKIWRCSHSHWRLSCSCECECEEDQEGILPLLPSRKSDIADATTNPEKM